MDKTQMDQQLEKNVKMVKYFFIFFIPLVVVITAWNIATGDQGIDPLGVGKDNVDSLIGQQVPYDKFKEWGNPQTLSSSTDDYWCAYLPKANISFIAKENDAIIIFADFGKESIIVFLKEKLLK